MFLWWERNAMRRVLIVVALAGLLLSAGCADLDIDDGPTVESAEPPTDDAETETDGDATDGMDGDEAPTDVEGELEIHHIDVGQADSTLVRTPDGETILIDTGDWRQSGSGVIAYLDAHGIDRIGHLIATHGHADHIGGHAAIIEEFETNREGIGAIYDSGVPHTSQTYENYLDAVDEHGHELLVVEDGDELPIDDDAVSGIVVNPPEGDSGSDLHDNSVAVLLEFGETRYLTTGDAETEAESRMIETWGEALDVDAYQAGHHGSSTSSTPPFMDRVSPGIAILSSNFDSQYGHPHDEVLEAFADRGIETYWTGVHGDIVLTSDGAELAVETAEQFSNDPNELLEAKHADDPEAAVAAPPEVAG